MQLTLHSREDRLHKGCGVIARERATASITLLDVVNLELEKNDPLLNHNFNVPQQQTMMVVVHGTDTSGRGST